MPIWPRRQLARTTTPVETTDSGKPRKHQSLAIGEMVTEGATEKRGYKLNFFLNFIITTSITNSAKIATNPREGLCYRSPFPRQKTTTQNKTSSTPGARARSGRIRCRAQADRLTRNYWAKTVEIEKFRHLSYSGTERINLPSTAPNTKDSPSGFI